MKHWLLVGYCLLLAWGLFRPQAPPQPAWLPHADKLEHLMAFMLLSLGVRSVLDRPQGWTASLVLLLAAPGLELLQHLMQPVRQFSLLDAVANLAGVLLGLLLWQMLTLIRKTAER